MKWYSAAVMCLGALALILGFAGEAFAFSDNAGSTSAAAVTADGDIVNAATANMKVTGMSCDRCAASIAAMLSDLDGVVSAEVSYDEGSATCRFDASVVSAESLREAVEAAGFKAVLVSN